nr:hypothetical protein [Micromonospora sp. DSM 115978]
MAPWSWATGPDSDPAGAVAAALGVRPAETVLTRTGGDGPQLLLTDACEAIVAGQVEVAAVVGCEVSVSQKFSLDAADVGRMAGVVAGPGGAGSRVVGSERRGFSDVELDRGLFLPVEVYALLERAVAIRDGLRPAAATARAAVLWSGLSAVAAANPHAWLPTYLPAQH